jgi:hypothetical protein
VGASCIADGCMSSAWRKLFNAGTSIFRNQHDVRIPICSSTIDAHMDLMTRLQMFHMVIYRFFHVVDSSALQFNMWGEKRSPIRE